MDGETARGGVRLGVTGLLVTAVGAVLAVLAALAQQSLLAAGAAAHLLVSLLPWLGLLLHERARARAVRERLEDDRLRALQAEGRRALFEGERGSPASAEAAAALLRWERVGQPLLAVVLAAAELLVAWGLWTWAPRAQAAVALPWVATLCGLSFALLLLGRYGFALARSGRLAAGAVGGRRATSGAAAALLAGLGLAAVHSSGLPEVDRLGYALLAVEALLGVEALLLLLLEAYRPRRRDEVARPPYDSRLLGLLSAPGDIARSIARSIDYQFGFALSQTWFYRFVARAVAPLLGFALLVLWGLSALVVVEPHEVGLLRRLGRLAPGEPLPPGLHLKLPWPVDEVERVPAGRVHLLETGEDRGDVHGGDEHGDDDHADEDGRRPAILWSEAHAGHGEGTGSLLLLARRLPPEAEGGDAAAVNLLAVSVSVSYRIADPRAWARAVDDPGALLRVLAERELAAVLSGADLDRLLLDRAARGAELQARLQEAARAHGLGLEVLGASLTELHPPAQVGRAFEALSAAQEKRQAAILAAEAEAARLVPAARARAEAIRLGAEAEARGRVALAAADVARFRGLMEVHRAAPTVFRTALLMQTLVAGAADARKIVVGERAARETDLDLEDRVRVDQVPLDQIRPIGEDE